jgi:hypothetical protein
LLAPLAALVREVDQWLEARLAQKGRVYDRNQSLFRFADRDLNDSAAHLDAQAETTDHRVSIAKDVSVLRIDHISTQSSLPGVWRGQHLKTVIVGVEINRCWVRQRTNMKNIKFVVKINRGGTRAPQYVQRMDSTPMQMTTNRKLALVMGRFTAEDAIQSLQNSRCVPELESVRVSA